MVNYNLTILGIVRTASIPGVALRTYQKLGYNGMLMPDHVLIVEGDTGGRQAFAFGNIRRLLHAVQS